MADVLQWLKESGGEYDESAIVLRQVDGMGWGAFALRDIPEETNLFSIPNDLLLSACTSGLRPLLRHEDWETLEESGGWASLMLCMMWEDSRGAESKWFGYMRGLPKTFDTPMFWSEADLKHLQGTDIVGKLGRESADKEYNEKVKPLMERYPEIFRSGQSTSSDSSQPTPFSLEDYHLQGSRILSRSFTVQASRAGRPPVERMNVRGDDAVEEDGEDDDDEEEDEEEDEQVMVPLADMLNAAFERDNANLYHEDDCLKMITTKDIKAGEQIYNTYGSPPNSHLLRKYGHVDVYPLDDAVLSALPESARKWPHGNMGDEVDIAGTEVIEACAELFGIGKVEERVDWWLEEDEDDMFTLAFGEDAIPPGLIAFTRLMLMGDTDWQKTQSKGKVPKPKIEPLEEGKKVLSVLETVTRRRESGYSVPLAESLALLDAGSLSLNERNAAIVRVGEQRVLLSVLARFAGMREGMERGKKRSADGAASSGAKKARSR